MLEGALRPIFNYSNFLRSRKSALEASSWSLALSKLYFSWCSFSATISALQAFLAFLWEIQAKKKIVLNLSLNLNSNLNYLPMLLIRAVGPYVISKHAYVHAVRTTTT